MAVIKVRISPDGSDLDMRVEGVQGSGCEEKTKSLEEAIFKAGEVKKEHTPEYFMEDVNVITNRL